MQDRSLIWGGATAALGAVLLAAVALFSGSEAMRERPCPPLRGIAAPTTPAAYVTAADTRLGGKLCVALDRTRLFKGERDALTAAEQELAQARQALAAAGGAQAPNAAAALARFNTATTSLQALPRARTVAVFFDDERVPAQPRSVPVQPPEGETEWALVEIPLQAATDASSNEARDWRKILGGPKSGGTRRVRVAVGFIEAEDRPPVVRAAIREPVTFRVYDPGWLAAGGVGLVLLAVGIGISGWRTGLLRDGGPGSAFSLGRAQMAFWFVLAIGGFLFIWLVSGQWRGVMTGGVIALLGISATTGVASRLVDAGDAASPPLASLGSFWRDILSDAHGPALHRIQLIAWTILLGGIFVWTVIWTFAFPDFDSNLLLLAGIAGGTYLGFKFREP